MAKKRIVMAIGHKDMGTNLPEQKAAVARTAKIIADFIQEGWQVVKKIFYNSVAELRFIKK